MRRLVARGAWQPASSILEVSAGAQQRARSRASRDTRARRRSVCPAAAGDLAPCPAAAAQTRACSTPTSANTSAAPTLRLVSAAPRRAARWPTALFAPSTAAARAPPPSLPSLRRALQEDHQPGQDVPHSWQQRVGRWRQCPRRRRAQRRQRTQEKDKRAGPPGLKGAVAAAAKPGAGACGVFEIRAR